MGQKTIKHFWLKILLECKSAAAERNITLPLSILETKTKP